MEDAFNWIKAAINGSKSEFHIEGCNILIELFTQKYKDEKQFNSAYNELTKDLIDKETFLIVEV